MKSNKSTIIFVFIFLFVIGIVSIIQTIYEIKSKSQIHILTIFSDTFIEPIRYTKKRQQNFEQLKKHVLSINKQNDTNDIIETVENAIFSVQDLKISYSSVNRYLSDTTFIQAKLLDTLENTLKKFKENIYETENFDNDYKTICTLTNSISNKQKISPVSMFKNTILNTTYLRKFEKDIEESSIVENSIRPVFQHLRFALLKDYGDKVIRGKNEWLFYKRDVEYLYRKSAINFNSTNENPLSVIVDFKNQLQEYGIDLLVVIVPTKPSIYPDLIASNLTTDYTSSVSPTHKFIQKLCENGVHTVDLFETLRNERKKDSVYNDSIYLQRDTHWKTRGVTCAAKTVAKKVKMFDWYDSAHETREFVLDSVYVDREGDIEKMTQLSESTLTNYTFAAEKTLCFQVHSVQRDSIGKIISKTLYRDDYKNSRILILGDSFSRIFQTDSPRSSGWIAHLANELSEPMATVVNDGGASTIVRQTLSRKLNLLKGKKLVIWEFVERDLLFGEQGWKPVSIKKQ